MIRNKKWSLNNLHNFINFFKTFHHLFIKIKFLFLHRFLINLIYYYYRLKNIINLNSNQLSFCLFWLKYHYTLKNDLKLIKILLAVKNPWEADRGEGWVVFKTWCFCKLTFFAFYWAGFPHNKKTTPSQFLLIIFITYVVKSCHPHLAWEFGLLS
jgi:hypothetical protein